MMDPPGAMVGNAARQIHSVAYTLVRKVSLISARRQLRDIFVRRLKLQRCSQCVWLAELPSHPGYQVAAVALVLQVTRNLQRLSTRLPRSNAWTICVALFGRKIADRDVGTFTGEGDCHGPADAAVPACYERPLSNKPAETLVGGLAMVCPGVISSSAPGIRVTALRVPGTGPAVRGSISVSSGVWSVLFGWR